MHIIKKENRIVIKPGKPTHISIENNHITVGKKPMEFDMWALPCNDKNIKKYFGRKNEL